MKTFKQTKDYIVEFATKKEACLGQLNRVKKATTKLQILDVIIDNIDWVFGYKLFNGLNIEEYFKKEDLNSSGVGNLGEGNTGFSNAGYSNAGNSNAGNRNAGNDNAGNSNAGNYNAGNRNAGYSNAGNSNAGNYNAGNYNAGNYNAGNRNAGYSNAGNDNAGAFNNLQANYVMFNKPSNWTYEDFTSSRAYKLLQTIETTMYVPRYAMSEEEKTAHPYHVTTGGYIKQLPYKESFTNAWNNWNEASRAAFTSLPNFDAAVFEDITGVKVA